MKASYSSGVLPTGILACARIRSRTSGIATTRAMSPDILCTSAGGVPAGAMNPNHAVISKPGKPASIIVGTSGTEGERCSLVIAIGRKAPDLMCGISTGAL